MRAVEAASGITQISRGLQHGWTHVVEGVGTRRALLRG